MKQAALAGKVALVTGAGRGIGRAIALRLAADGASVVTHYNGSAAGAEETADAIRAKGGEAVVYQADITRREQVAALFAAIDKAPGRIDIVVNSSGVSGGGKLAALDEAQLEWMLGVNLRGPLFVASEAARRLGEGGRIINLSSTLAEFPIAGAGVYSATKAALQSFTQQLGQGARRQGRHRQHRDPRRDQPGHGRRLARIPSVLRNRLAVQTHRPRGRNRGGGRVPGVARSGLGVGGGDPGERGRKYLKPVNGSRAMAPESFPSRPTFSGCR